MTELIVPAGVDEILNRPPIKLSLLNHTIYQADHRLAYVTSPNIFEPNSRQFHPAGLFSEEIFGSITSMDRFTTEAMIKLNTKIIHPVKFALNIRPKNLFVSIMSGKQYAIFDDEEKTFVVADKLAEDSGTGFQFFLTHFEKMADSPEPEALRAGNLHKLFGKYKDCFTISEIVCLPAGLRDLDMKSSRLSKDDVNKLYMNLLNLAASLSNYDLSEDPIFDGIRYQIQLRVNDIFVYLMDVVSGKGGFLQKHYGARKIAYSTRNVITVSVNEADSPEDPKCLKSDETMVSLLNTIKCFQPFFTNFVKKKLYGELFVHGSTEKIPATNPDSLAIEYITLKSSTINRYTNTEEVNRIINQFKYVGFRESAINIPDISGKLYYLLLTYASADKVFIGKTLDDLKRIGEAEGVTVEKKGVKPLYWVEAMYIAAVDIVKGKHGFITRYPVLGDGSIYASKLLVATTNPSKTVEVIFDSGYRVFVPHYPIIGNPYYESIIVHPSRLPGLGADFDGDCVSLTTVWTKEGNEDIANNFESISCIVGSDMKLKIGVQSDIVELAIFNLSRQDLVA